MVEPKYSGLAFIFPVLRKLKLLFNFKLFSKPLTLPMPQSREREWGRRMFSNLDPGFQLFLLFPRPASQCECVVSCQGAAIFSGH